MEQQASQAKRGSIYGSHTALRCATTRADAQWACSADMPAGYSFGRISVSCEGYDYPDDPYVLRGSCGLEYELRYDSSAAGASPNTRPTSPYDPSRQHSTPAHANRPRVRQCVRLTLALTHVRSR